MKKIREPISGIASADVLFNAQSTCCVCNVPGLAIQIHHIDENPSNNDIENLAVLCLQHHSETQTTGGFGRKLSADLVRKHRDNWNQRVVERRREADRLAAVRMAIGDVPPADGTIAFLEMKPEPLVNYLMNIPVKLRPIYQAAHRVWDEGNNAKSLSAAYTIVDFLQQVLVNLARYYPSGHFGDVAAERYFSQFVSDRFAWHRSRLEPRGPGTGGTIIGPMAASSVIDDATTAIDDLVTALSMEPGSPIPLTEWREQMKNSTHPAKS